MKEVTRENTGVKPGDVLTRIGSVATDNMSLKEAKKLMDQCKDRLSIVVTRDNSCCHVQQVKNETGEYLSGTTSYSSQNLYVPPPTRQPIEDKSNLVPRGRARGPLMDVSLSQLDLPATPTVDPPRPPPPRPEGIISMYIPSLNKCHFQSFLLLRELTKSVKIRINTKHKIFFRLLQHKKTIV